MNGSGWSAPELMVKPGVAGSRQRRRLEVRRLQARARCHRRPRRARRSRGTCDGRHRRTRWPIRAPALRTHRRRRGGQRRARRTTAATQTVDGERRLDGAGRHRLTMGKNWGRRRRRLGMTRRKVGRTSGFRESPLTSRGERRNLSVSSETTARRTSSEHRKVGAREAQREAARRNGGKPRERCKAGSRDGSEPRKGSVTGVGRRIRSEMVRGASRWLPWSRRGRLGRGLSDTTPARCQRVIVDVAPRSTGGFGRTVTRGCVASGPWFVPLPLPMYR